MKFIVRLFSEITVKSSPVRKKMVRQLRRNIRKICGKIDPCLLVNSEWDLIHLSTDNEDNVVIDAVREALTNIPGIHHFSEVTEHPLLDLDQLVDQCVTTYHRILKEKTFAVRVKRAGKHSFTSVEAERYIGSGLVQYTQSAGVDLTNPDVLVKVEIKDDRYFLIQKRYNGIGGFPLGTQEPVLSLISGGFDSSVASYMMMKRGINTHFCFFNLGGYAHEKGVKEVVAHLWKKYGASHYVRFISVPFQEVVKEILTKTDPSYRGVILKRMMLRAAEAVAKEMKIPALVTGEAVAQVSSQTISNLSVINKATNMLVVRPLIAMGKQDIIDTARKIGTESISSNIPEYCAVISTKPTTKANLHKVVAQEEKFDFSLLNEAIKQRKDLRITYLYEMEKCEFLPEIDIVTVPQDSDIIIDVRHPADTRSNPLEVKGFHTMEIPFYQLATKMKSLDSTRRYLLYCDRNVVSRLHALHLVKEGLNNIAIYLKPESKGKL